jgi:Tat protein secretion system quality control protein TatD with DNase activity
MLTETDGPFCQHAGRPAQPIDVSVVINLLAQVMIMKSADIAIAVLSNLRRIETFE